jgi:hypothetical protein
MPKRTPSVYREEFVYERKGKTYECSFTITGTGPHATLGVITPMGSKTAHLGNTPAKSLARLLAGETFTAANLS